MLLRRQTRVSRSHERLQLTVMMDEYSDHLRDYNRKSAISRNEGHSKLSVHRFFQILVLKRGSHPVDLGLSDTVSHSFVAPFRDDFGDLCGYLTGLGSVQFKILSHCHGQCK